MLIQLLYICNVFISISLLKENRMKRNRIIELQFFFQNFKAFDLQNSFFFYLQNSCLPYVLCFSPVLLRSDIRSAQISRSVVSGSLRPHESQHARPPCPSPTPGVHSDSHPSSQRCHPAISSSVVPFSSCPQSLPASESFPMSQLFA